MRLWAPVLLLAACGPHSPEAVSDKFIDYYLVEMDQGRAMPLASGLARDMLERELRDVASIRKQMGYMPADARPEIYYQRTRVRDEGDRKVLIYDVTVKHKQDVQHKSAEIALRREGETWKVVFYKLSDG
jgi:hypothetical protein